MASIHWNYQITNANRPIYYIIMTRLEIQTRINQIRDELEARHKYGTVKMASEDGKPIPTEKLQNEMYSLVYKLSKID